MERLAVILPSRGMSFSKTCDELLKELDGIDYKIFFSIANTIPDCFNIPLEEAIKDPTFTHILIIEDDMIIPRHILRVMLNKKYPVVALDYPFKNDGEATTLHDPSGMALFTGTGFMLIERWVIELISKPVFRTDIAWDMMITKDNKLIIWSRNVSKIKRYGLHDINFGITMWSNNIPILVLNRTAGQRKLISKGKNGINDGVDSIYEITKVLKDNITKTTNIRVIKGYIDRLNKVNSIELLSEPPDTIEYINGKAMMKDSTNVII